MQSLLVALALCPAHGARVSVHGELNQTQAPNPQGFQPVFQNPYAELVVNPGPDGPLIPQLVPPPGQMYHFEVRELVNIIEANHYNWVMTGSSPMGRTDATVAAGLVVSQVRGTWHSSAFGWRRVHVSDASGTPIYDIRNAQNAWNPFSWRWSWRVLPVEATDADDAYYTLNRDKFGRGLFWAKEEWFLWRGRERDEQLVYYCLGTWIGWHYDCYHSKDDYLAEAVPIATIDQNFNLAALDGFGSFLPDMFALHVGEGIDSALLLAMLSTIDMSHDATVRARSNAAGGGGAASRHSLIEADVDVDREADVEADREHDMLDELDSSQLAQLSAIAASMAGSGFCSTTNCDHVGVYGCRSFSGDGWCAFNCNSNVHCSNECVCN